MKKSDLKIGPIDFFLFSVIMLLVAIGVVMVYSASSYSAFFNPNYKDSMFFFKKQALWALIGIVAMFFAIKIDYHKYKKYT
ncbi:MAG: cell cycle protein FtsW/RodA/SpoVE family, partial [Clostridiaceae bacterium]|nr:cell cycle protein FtsW/RodA/SpoVE family [Clostridiaceae bacterium]